METYKIDEHTLLRFAEKKDAPLLLQFIRALAEYEHLEDQVQAEEKNLKKYIFDDKRAEALICEYDGTPAGFALFFHTFSTFVGRPGLYIEDLFVKPEFRGRGLGKLLLVFTAKVAAERNCGRLEWACLNWNEPSIAFYKSQGARPLSEWTTYRVTGEELGKLAQQGPRPPEPA
ncbi:MAG: GNAT family N-acetyltransferase [Treponema sp.]|jgi:GNAT superfamily N-acetyltransferase|nr:GNAT family N-acetyltransferase [Treponema sp.]